MKKFMPLLIIAIISVMFASADESKTETTKPKACCAAKAHCTAETKKTCTADGSGKTCSEADKAACTAQNKEQAAPASVKKDN